MKEVAVREQGIMGCGLGAIQYAAAEITERAERTGHHGVIMNVAHPVA
jgi:hypothetical protein